MSQRDTPSIDSLIAREQAALSATQSAQAAQGAGEVVAWRDHVEQRLHSWRQRFVNKSGDQLALDDFMDKESLGDLIDYVCDEWSGPVTTQPAAGADVLLAIATVRESYRGTDWGKVAECICDAIDAAIAASGRQE